MSKAKHQSHDPDIGCLEAIEGLYAWLDGELEDPEDIAAVEDHVLHCTSCYSRAEIEKILTKRIRESASREDPSRSPERLQQRVKSLIAKL
jgi:anti-sigma factor (TIGR02949 family)